MHTTAMPKTLVLISVLLAAAAWMAVPQSDPKLLAHARDLHKQTPLIDGHNDYPWALREKAGRDLDKLDISKSQPSIMTDIPRLRAGGVAAQFWSVYTPADPAERGGQSAVTMTLEQIDIVHRMVRKWPETFELALTADDVERIFKKGRIASLIGMEGGHSIDSSLANLRMFARLGARYMTLTHNKNLPWGDAATDDVKLGGLSKFGEEVVREMNWLGMLVDLSHVSPHTMEDALRVTAAPVIFSHSSARAICDVPRNVPDSILQKLPKNGGVVMVTFVPGFISPESPAYRAASQPEQDRLKARYPNDPAAAQKAFQDWQKSHPEPTATLAQVADHIDHIRKVAGIDHIGIGSDFDGITSTVVGLTDVSTYPALTAELLRRGYKDDDIRKILGLNVLRVMREAEKVSARLQKERGPSTATIDQLDGKPPTDPAQGREDGAPLDVTITLERTVCFGTCPDYKVTIDGLGNVVYEGRRFVKVEGTHRAKIAPEQVAALIAEFKRIGFFELKDSYEALVTDLPTTYTSLTLGGRTKRIKDYYGAPEMLRGLEKKIDEVAGTAKWVK